MVSTIKSRSEEIFKVKPAVSVKNIYGGITLPQNPGLAPNDFSNAHQDSWASESVSLTGPTSDTLKLIKQAHRYGLTGVHTCNSDNQMIAVGAWLGVGFTLIVYDRDCRIISATPLESSFGLSFAGGYFYLDNNDHAIVASGFQLFCYPTNNVEVKDDVYALTPIWQTDNLVELVTGQKDDSNAIYSALPVWGQPNHYWCLFAGHYDIDNKILNSYAYVAVIKVIEDSTATNGCVTTLVDKVAFPNEYNNNSISADEEALYFVLNTVTESGEPASYGTLRKTVFDSSTMKINGGWVYQYESCGLLLVGQTNIGSGTTPTLTEDGTSKLVGITDNASPQVNTVVVDRVTGTLVSKTPVFSKMRSADEASLIGIKNSFIVENNYGHTISVLPQLVSNEPGMQSVTVDATNKTSQVEWNNSYTTFFGMSMLARGSGIIFGFSGSWRDEESSTSGGFYSVVAMDSYTGRIIWSVPVGRGMMFCHEYGGFYFNKTGDLFVGANGHLICIQNASPSDTETMDHLKRMMK